MPLAIYWDAQHDTNPTGLDGPEPAWWAPAQRVVDRLDRLAADDWERATKHGPVARAALYRWGDAIGDATDEYEAALTITMRFRNQERDGRPLVAWIENRAGTDAVATVAGCVLCAVWPDLPALTRVELCGPLRSLMEDA